MNFTFTPDKVALGSNLPQGQTMPAAALNKVAQWVITVLPPTTMLP